jgi:hypothetical protein
VETTRRVQAGMPPFEAFDQDTQIINEALHQIEVVTLPPDQPKRLRIYHTSALASCLP